jgi:hypothetical protein
LRGRLERRSGSCGEKWSVGGGETMMGTVIVLLIVNIVLSVEILRTLRAGRR